MPYVAMFKKEIKKSSFIQIQHVSLAHVPSVHTVLWKSFGKVSKIQLKKIQI